MNEAFSYVSACPTADATGRLRDILKFSIHMFLLFTSGDPTWGSGNGERYLRMLTSAYTAIFYGKMG
jgi:hypothetical protein